MAVAVGEVMRVVPAHHDRPQRPPLDLGYCGVVDLELPVGRQRMPQQQAQDHTDRAAVGDPGDRAVRVRAQDLVEQICTRAAIVPRLSPSGGVRLTRSWFHQPAFRDPARRSAGRSAPATPQS